MELYVALGGNCVFHLKRQTPQPLLLLEFIVLAGTLYQLLG